MAHSRQTCFEELWYQHGSKRRQTRKAKGLEFLGLTTHWEDLAAPAARRRRAKRCSGCTTCRPGRSSARGTKDECRDGNPCDTS